MSRKRAGMLLMSEAEGLLEAGGKSKLPDIADKETLRVIGRQAGRGLGTESRCARE